MSDEEKEKLSKNATVYTQEYEYDDSDVFNGLNADWIDVSLQNYNLYRAVESDISSPNFDDNDVDYTWYKEDAEVNRTQVLDEDEEPVKGNYYCPTVYATDGDVTYVCVKTLKSVTCDGYDAEGNWYEDESMDLTDETIPEGYSNTVETVFKFKYTGLTAKDFETGSADLSDYFNGIDSIQDATFELEIMIAMNTMTRGIYM